MNRAPDRLPQLVVCSCYPHVSRADGRDVFVHYSGIEGYGFRSLEENQHVEFEVTQGQRGLQATHVRA
jgi:CspA family cold shock protein